MSTTTTLPKVGQKVYLQPDQYGNWHGIPAEYQTAIGTVVTVTPTVDGTKHIIAAEFKSIQKPDDTVRWSAYDWKPAYEIGDVVRVISGVGSGSDLLGRIGTIVSIDGTAVPYLVQGVSASMPNESYWFATEQIEAVVDGETLTVSEPVTFTQDDIDVLNRDIEVLRNRLRDCEARADRYISDWNTAGTLLLEEAERRGWCSEFDEFIDTVNGRTQVLEWENREVEVDIQWEETYTVTVPRSGTVTLKRGYDSDDIEEAARRLNGDDDASASDVIQAVRDGNYEADEFVEDSAEEA